MPRTAVAVAVLPSNQPGFREFVRKLLIAVLGRLLLDFGVARVHWRFCLLKKGLSPVHVYNNLA
jgi:hypothetical protein